MNNSYQYSPQKFSSLPPVCKNLLIINAIVFLAGFALSRRGIHIEDYLGLHFFASSNHHIWQYITYSFVHANFNHILVNMFALWMFGVTLENMWGARRFIFYCLLAALGAAIMQEITYFFMYGDLITTRNELISSTISYVNTGKEIMPKAQYLERLTDIIDNINTVGASGIVFGLLLAFGMMFPNSYIYLYFLVPIKAKWFVIGYMALELYNGVFRTADGIAHFAHLGGALAGFILIMIWSKGKFRFR